jgi:hypothetical protein
MTQVTRRYLIVTGLALAGWLGNGDFGPHSSANLVATAQAVVGRPATPVSYAGVARRSTVGVGAPGVGVAPGLAWGAGSGRAPGGAPGVWHPPTAAAP